MTSEQIAQRTGVTLDDADCLLRGFATRRVAEKVGVEILDVDEFITGTTSAGMARRLDLTPAEADGLAQAHGRAGAIEVIVDLMTP